MGIAENIDALLVKHDITAESLARIAGVQPPTVSRWRHGVIPREEPIRKITEYFSISRDDLVSDKFGLAAKEHGTIPNNHIPSNAMFPNPEPKKAYAPLYGKVHAGKAEEPDVLDDHIPIPYEIWVNHKNGYFLQVEGDCMNKVYPEGCYVFIDPDKQPVNGSIVVVSIDEVDYVMRRLYQGASVLVLSPDSFDDSYDDIVFTDPEDHFIQCKGVVVWYQPAEELK